MRLRVKGGWKIRLESGRLLPKRYKSVMAVEKRIGQLKSFSKNKRRK